MLSALCLPFAVLCTSATASAMQAGAPFLKSSPPPAVAHLEPHVESGQSDAAFTDVIEPSNPGSDDDE